MSSLEFRSSKSPLSLDLICMLFVFNDDESITVVLFELWNSVIHPHDARNFFLFVDVHHDAELISVSKRQSKVIDDEVSLLRKMFESIHFTS